MMDGGNLPLGGGTPGGKSHYPAAFEESKARADERRLDRNREGMFEPDRRAQALGRLFLAGVAILLMAFAAWEALGPAAGLAAVLGLVVGAYVLWRFWR